MKHQVLRLVINIAHKSAPITFFDALEEVQDCLDADLLAFLFFLGTFLGLFTVINILIDDRF